MCKLNSVLISVAILLLVLSAAGCDSSSYGSPMPGPDLITVSLPYVEAVHFPAEVHAGQPFAITLDISSDLNPLALHSPARPFPDTDLWAGGQYNTPGGIVYSTVIRPYRDLTQASSSLPVVASVTYELDHYPAGVQELYYYSAGSREQGGVNISYDRRTQAAYEDISAYSKSIEFTVLP
jgi:hypothetical protein